MAYAVGESLCQDTPELEHSHGHGGSLGHESGHWSTNSVPQSWQGQRRTVEHHGGGDGTRLDDVGEDLPAQEEPQRTAQLADHDDTGHGMERPRQVGETAAAIERKHVRDRGSRRAAIDALD